MADPLRLVRMTYIAGQKLDRIAFYLLPFSKWMPMLLKHDGVEYRTDYLFGLRSLIADMIGMGNARAVVAQVDPALRVLHVQVSGDIEGSIAIPWYQATTRDILSAVSDRVENEDQLAWAKSIELRSGLCSVTDSRIEIYNISTVDDLSSRARVDPRVVVDLGGYEAAVNLASALHHCVGTGCAAIRQTEETH